MGLTANRHADSALRADDVVWHDLECGSYRADLDHWLALARAHAPAGGSRAVLDVGAGTGRVALALAQAGHRVIALEREPAFVEALRERAGSLPLEAVCGEARTFSLPAHDVGLLVVAMQTIQLFGGASGRAQFLARAREHLADAGRLACGIVTDPEPFDVQLGDSAPTPEMAEIAGRVYRSTPTRVSVEAAEVTIERRRAIFPEGSHAQPARLSTDTITLDRLDAPTLRREACEAGFRDAGELQVPSTPQHVGTEIVMFDA